MNDTKTEEMSTQILISLAKDVAEKAHYGQFRFDGTTPYFHHPMAVADKVEDRLKPIAYLHDVPEDTSVKLDDLRRMGFPKYVLDAVDLLTKKPNQEYWMYLQNMVHNPDAVKVKLADIEHNLSSTPTKSMTKKYLKALDFFKSKGFST